jgi:hypothetical protein
MLIKLLVMLFGLVLLGGPVIQGRDKLLNTFGRC